MAHGAKDREGGGEEAPLEALGSQAVSYRRTDDLLGDVRSIIEESQRFAYRAVNNALVRRNWLLGKRIAEEELRGEERAEYGNQVIKSLARALTREYGKGFTRTNLYHFTRFYKSFPEIFHAASGQSSLLSWTHYRILLQVANPETRTWYAREAAEQMWSVRTLQRNIDSQYHERMLLSQHPDKVKREMERITEPYQKDKLEFVRNPVVAEFLGLVPNSDVAETDLETSILAHLQKVLLVLG